MPSEEQTRGALEALAGPIDHFRSALTTALEEVHDYLATQRTSASEQRERLRRELGVFAEGRVDVDALLEIIGPPVEADPAMIEWVERAMGTLEELEDKKEELFSVEVEPGAGLRDKVDAALAEAGRVFGAARVIRLARSGGLTAEHEGMLAGFPFHRWSRAERQLAPPLVIRVEGQDLQAGGLADFLDGNQKLLLVVEGEAPPAPLARLVTPSIMVVQASAAEGMQRLNSFSGAGIGAILPEGAALFVHDPVAGGAPWQRMSVEHMPDQEPRKAVGRISVDQQREDLRHLSTLAEEPRFAEIPAAEEPEKVAAGVTPEDETPPDEKDRLAAWLLSQADLGGA